MTYQRTKPTKPHHTDNQTTKHFNVTEMTPNQRRKLFIDCMNQNGFVGFIKNEGGKQTCYIFRYENRS